MNTMQEKTFYQLAGNAIESIPTSELFRLANEHPYFAPAQYFLAHKLKSESHPGFLPQLQKAALFFNNPYWLHYQLLNRASGEIRIIHKQYQEEETKPLLQNVIREEIAQQQETAKHDTAVEAFLQETRKQAPVVNLFPIEQKEEEPIAALPIEIPTVETVREMMGNIQGSGSEAVTSKETQGEDETVSRVDDPLPSVTSFALEAAELDVFPSTVQPDGPIPSMQEQAQEKEDAFEAGIEETPLPSIDNDAAMTEENVPENTEQVQEEPAPEKLTGILSQQLEEFRKPVAEDAVLNIATEPYHTVDYFASQGIKVGADFNSQDKLSKQLRKFTDWLKHMKHVEVDPQDLGTDPELESAIHSIANTSNEAREIVTETMAEVLEKQGKIDKAIQLYIKLSFLNPDKSTYFAARIQKLKGITL